MTKPDLSRFDIPADRPWRKVYAEHGIDIHVNFPENINSLVDLFNQSFERFGSNIAFTCMDISITYDELNRYSMQLAAYLQSLGLQKGDKVAVMMPNILQYPISMLAIVRAGMVLVNVNPMYTSHELEHQLIDSEAKAILIVENFAHTFEKVQNKGQVEHTIVCAYGDIMALKGMDLNEEALRGKNAAPAWQLPDFISFQDVIKTTDASGYTEPKLELEDIAVLQYTGGTTGVSKGAMLCHRNLIANVCQAEPFFMSIFEPDEDTTGQYIAVALPLYHIYSFTACQLLGMKLGFSMLLITNPRDLDAIAKYFGKYRPVYFPGVNTLFNALAHHEGFRALDHSNLRKSVGGGMSVLIDTANAWEQVTGHYMSEGYGLSETSPMLTVNPPNVGFTGKIGMPGPSTDIILLDDNDRQVAIGEAGEICVKGPQVMKGYWKRDDETAKVMTADGYFRTGDIGVMDGDGYIKLVDRKKDMILVSGFNVYPNEVEDTMTLHPKILECGVVGVADEHSGEVPKIYIVKSDPSLTVDEVRAWAKENLTGYKRPKYIEFITELPKSNVGKILRKDLRKIARAQHGLPEFAQHTHG